MIFFNPNYAFNQIYVKFCEAEKPRRPFKVIEIVSNSYNKEIVCYINCVSAEAFDFSNRKQAIEIIDNNS
jgi:hypothetical protein